MKFDRKLAGRSKFVLQEAVNFGLKPLYTSLISLVVIRFFDVQFWGKFVFYLVVVQLFITFLNWGQKPHLTKLFATHPNMIGAHWGRAFVARLPLLGIVFVAITVLPKLQQFVIPLTIWVLFKWLTVMMDSLIQYNRDYKISIVAEIISIIVSTILLFVWVEKVDLEFLIYVFALSNGMKFIWLLPVFFKNKIIIPSIKGSNSELLLALPLFALTLAGMFQTKGDLYLATFLMNESELGKYQILIGFLLLGQAFSGIVLGPFLKNVFRLQHEEIVNFKGQYLKIGLFASFVFSIGVYFLISYVYLIRIELETLLLIFAYVAPLYFYLIESQVLIKRNKERQLLTFTVITAIVNFGMSLLLIPFWGINGAMISGVLSKIILAILVVNLSKRV